MCYMNALETMAPTEKNNRFAINNLVRIIVGVKRAEKRRMDEIRVAIGVKESVKKILAMSRWAGRVEGMGDEKLTKRGKCSYS